MVLAFNKAPRGQFLVLAQCAPLSSSAPPGSLGCWPTKHLPAAPAARLTGGALVILTVLSAGAPPIALAISYGSSSSQPQGPALRGQSGLSGQVSPHSNYVRRSFAFARSIEILRVLRPRFPRPSGSPVLPKSLMLTLLLLNVSIISDHEDPSRASGFHSHHHIEVGNSSCSAIRTWSPYHGEGKVTL